MLVLRRTRALIAPSLFVSLAGGCAEAPPPPPAPVPPTPPPAPVAAPAPARWIEGGGATMIGPKLAGGTLVLLGGRRTLVKADGSIESEKSPAPDALAEIVEVPAAGGTRLVGRGAREIYRFDDPLGPAIPIARSERAITRIGAGPGAVAVWVSGSDIPRFVDLDTGADKPVAGLPEPPLRAVAFADQKRGAGVFEIVGLAITSDGGATWKRAAEANAGDALRMNGLRRDDRGVRAFMWKDGNDAAIDLDAGKLGRLESARTPPAGEPPLLRWVRITGRDPLEAVATGGLDLPTGQGLVASHGLLARVDPKTGSLVDMVELTKNRWVGPCGAGRTGQSAWIACALPEDTSNDLYDPFGVIRVPVGDGTPAPEAPVVVRNGEAELRVSPSGGAMLLGSCGDARTDGGGGACVRQPDGKWKTIRTDVDLLDHGAGALADGRLVFFRSMFDGDEDADGERETQQGNDEARGSRLRLAVVGADGKEKPLATVSYPASRGYVRVQSPIEEDTDHTLRAVIEDGEGPLVVIAALKGEAAQAQKVPGAAAARMHAGRGIAVGEGKVLASLDGGATWNEVPTTAAARDAATSASNTYEDPTQLAVSELGAKIGGMLRIGWGPADAAVEPPPPAGTPPLLPAPRPPPSGAEHFLTCASQGPSTAAPPLSGTSQVRQLLLGPEPKTRPAPKPGVRHETSTWGGSHASMLDTVALFEEEGPEGRGAAPAKWTFRWHDPQEIGGKPRSVTMPAPKGLTMGASLRSAAASGARALFTVRTSSKTMLVRIRATGAPEVAEVPFDLSPSADVVFGSERGEAIAWTRDTSVIVWLAGERPRAIAKLATHVTRVLGTPTVAGVPVLLSASDWALARVLPIPPLDKGAAAPPPPEPPSFEGWTRVPPLAPRLASLPACAAKPAGMRFSLSRTSLRAEIDGIPEHATETIYDVRVANGEACIAGLGAALTPDRRSPPPPPAGQKPAKTPPKNGPAFFVRADLSGKRAEGGDRGVAPAAAVRGMKCSLGGKP